VVPSNFSIMLGISILLWLPAVTAVADDLAAPADLAELASREQQLRAKIDDRLLASVVAVTEVEGQTLSLRMTERLWQDDSPPPAKRAPAGEPATTRLQSAGDTVCTSAGNTLECVLEP
jgi:hypothetical protein